MQLNLIMMFNSESEYDQRDPSPSSKARFATLNGIRALNPCFPGVSIPKGFKDSRNRNPLEINTFRAVYSQRPIMAEDRYRHDLTLELRICRPSASKYRP